MRGNTMKRTARSASANSANPATMATPAMRTRRRRLGPRARKDARAKGIMGCLAHCNGSNAASGPDSLHRFRPTPYESPIPSLMNAPHDLAAALAYSHYATQALAAFPQERSWLESTLDSPLGDIAADVRSLADAGDAAELAKALRLLRRRTVLHTLARDLTGRADLAEVCRNMTTLAETSLVAAVSLHHAALAAIHGEPRDRNGIAQKLIVLRTGKTGGSELNVSSDVDLVFVYPDEGETDGARPLANQEFFDRLGRRVAGALNDATADGFVFRVDMRLRPYGESGPP